MRESYKETKYRQTDIIQVRQTDRDRQTDGHSKRSITHRLTDDQLLNIPDIPDSGQFAHLR